MKNIADQECEKLLERNREIRTFPKQDLSNLSKDELRKRAEILEKTFDDLFGESEINNKEGE